MFRRRAAIADKGSFRNPPALLPLKVLTDLVADMAGTAEGIAEENLSAGIGLFAAEAVDAEVMRVVKTAFIPCVGGSVFEDFIRNG